MDERHDDGGTGDDDAARQAFCELLGEALPEGARAAQGPSSMKFCQAARNDMLFSTHT